jgi:hypothetical protein
MLGNLDAAARRRPECGSRRDSVVSARDHVERRTAGVDVRAEELGDVLGRAVRRVALERLEGHLVEELHLRGQWLARGVTR